MSSPRLVTVSLELGDTTTALVYPAAHSPGATFVLAHGAGAGQRSAFMASYAEALAALGIDVVTFNFPYTERGRRLPDRAPVLEACYTSVIDAVRRELPSADHTLVIGGKSMGGRIATHVAAARPDITLAGLVLLGYPLHPPGRPEQRRDAHLPSVRRPMLFVQGERDTFGTPGELSPILGGLSPRPALHVVERGDHSFKVARLSRPEQEAVHDEIRKRIAEWIGGLGTQPV